MKYSRMVLLLAIIVTSTTFAMEKINFEGYVQGITDHNGNNLWHILADACDKKYFAQYIKILKSLEATEEDAKTLAFLASERNNQDQSPLDIAVANWVVDENKRCADIIKMIHTWKMRGTREYKSKKINECPFADFFAHIEEQEKAVRENAECENLNSGS